MTDRELIRLYAERHDEAAFRILVERHAGMVYGVALRRTEEGGLAEEIAQNVFVRLAQKSASLDPDRVVGWLYGCTMLEAAQALRKRRREFRKRHEYARELETMKAKISDPQEISGMMDEALGELSPADRELILAKFYEGLTYREISARSTQSEGALRKRGSRALEKLSRLLHRKGVIVPVAALGGQLEGTLDAASPLGLVDAIEGRVANLAESEAFSVMSALGSVWSSSIGLSILAAVIALIPITTGWGTRTRVDTVYAIKPPNVSLLGARRAVPTVPRATIPSIDDILQAHGTDRIALLIAWLGVADAEALDAMAEAIESNLLQIASESSADLFFSLYLQRGFAVMPEETLSRTERWRTKERSLSGILREAVIFVLWSEVDPEGAWLEARSRSAQLAGAVIEGVRKSDPWQAYEWAKDLSPEDAGVVVEWEELFRELAENNVEEALGAARKLAGPMAQTAALKAVLAQMAKTNPVRAMEEAAAIAEPQVKLGVREAILKEWLKTDRSTAWENISKLEPGLGRLRLAREAGAALASEEPDEARSWIASIEDHGMRRSAWAGLAVALATTDPERARYALEQLNGDLREVASPTTYVVGGSGRTVVDKSPVAAAKTVIMHLAESDPVAALAFTSSITSRSTRHVLERPLTAKLVREDPANVAELIVNLPESPTRATLASQLAQELPDPAAALEWANNLDGKTRESAVGSLIRRLRTTDLATIVAAVPDFDAMDAENQATFVDAWLGNPGEARNHGQIQEAREWLEAQPEHEAFSRAYQELTNNLARVDPDQAVDFVESLNAGPLQQEAISGLLGHLGNQSPMNYEAVIHWIERSEIERTRQFWLTIMAKDWIGKDPEAAIEWFGNSDLKPAEWDQLLSRQQLNQERLQE